MRRPEEIQALAKVVARRGGIYATHMRSEGGTLLEAIDEALDVARASGVRLQISHLKTAGRANWHKLDAALEKIRAAQAEGIEVASDRYPYTASCTDLDVILPTWSAQGGRAAILARLRDPADRAKIRAEMAAARDENIGRTSGSAARIIRTTRRSRASPSRWRRRRGSCIRSMRRCGSWRRTSCSPAASSSG
jgi:N-acyl-D-amino-acid deacylase